MIMRASPGKTCRLLAAVALAVSTAGCALDPKTGTARTRDERLGVGAGLLLTGLEVLDALRADAGTSGAAAQDLATARIVAALEVYCGLSEHGRMLFMERIPEALQTVAAARFGGADADVCTAG